RPGLHDCRSLTASARGSAWRACGHANLYPYCATAPERPILQDEDGPIRALPRSFAVSRGLKSRSMQSKMPDEPPHADGGSSQRADRAGGGLSEFHFGARLRNYFLTGLV